MPGCSCAPDGTEELHPVRAAPIAGGCAPAGADQSWFHLYEVTAPEGDGTDEDEKVAAAAVALEQFMQTAPLGEYVARLQLLASFRRQSQVGSQGSSLPSHMLTFIIRTNSLFLMYHL